MNLTSLVSMLKEDLYDLYRILWNISVIEAGEGDINLAIVPATMSGECVIGFNLYLFYTRLVMEMTVDNAPPIMSTVFNSMEKNGKNNLLQIEAFENMLLNQNGHLKYMINKDTYWDKHLAELKNIRWLYFSLRYESEYLNVHNRLDFNYEEIRQYVLFFAGFMLLFSSYQEAEDIALHKEGMAYLETSIRYERNPINRELCLENKGYRCSVCGIDMESVYGIPGKQFIEVHHAIPVSSYEHERMIDPLSELFPVCPNCHAMLHRRQPPYSIEELKQLMKEAGGKREEK